MIKNIIFDLENVMVQNPSIETVNAFFKDKNEAIKFNDYIFKSEFWKLMDLGQISNLEVANKIKENLLVDIKNYNEVEMFMMNWFTKCNVNKETMDLGIKLKEKGYNIYILSNMAKATFEYFCNKYEFFNIVNGAVVSGYEGVKKPDRRIFEILINRYSLDPDNCLLIDDDDTNKTIEVANSFGIKARRVNANDVNDVKKLLLENNIEL